MSERSRMCLAAIVLSAASGCATAPPPDSAKAVIEARFAAVNRHAVAEIVELYAPNAELTASNFCRPQHGRDAVQGIYQSMFATFPGLVADVQEYLVQGDRVAVKFIVRIPGPEKPIEVPIANFYTVRDGLIVRDDGVFDTHGRSCS